MELVKNMVVEIFNDPITEKALEGKARILSFERRDKYGEHTLEYWKVRFFDGDIVDGDIVYRYIKARY